MNGEELLRIVDTIRREKDIDKEVLFESIETALATAVRKKHGVTDEMTVRIDRLTGELEAFIGDEPTEVGDLGRIAAQTAKQVIIQRIRDAEQDVILREYHHKVGTIVNGTVQRIEGGNIIVNLGKAEGIVPRSEKVRGENYNPGERIKAVIHEVRRVGPKVRIVLSRGAPALVVRLFELEVPEIADGIIEVKRVAREPGFRTKIAVSSYDTRVDCIGACVGIRGTRIKSITDELNGEKIDIIRWNESIEVLIMNALKPAEVETIHLDEASKQAMVIVPDDQLSLGIGRKGQNVRLASKLVDWEIKITSTSQAAQEPLDFTSRELTDEDKKLLAGASALGLSLSDLQGNRRPKAAVSAPNPLESPSLLENPSPSPEGSEKAPVDGATAESTGSTIAEDPHSKSETPEHEPKNESVDGQSPGPEAASPDSIAPVSNEDAGLPASPENSETSEILAEGDLSVGPEGSSELDSQQTPGVKDAPADESSSKDETTIG